MRMPCSTQKLRDRKRWKDAGRILLRGGGLALAVLLLAACAPPPVDPISGVACDWIDLIKTGGLALATIFLFASFMIIVVSYGGLGIVWAGLYNVAQRLVNGAIVAFLLLLIGIPVFWWILSQAGAPCVPGGS